MAISKKGKYRLAISGLLIFFSSICSLGPYYIAYLIIENIINPPLIINELLGLGGVAALFIVGQMIFSGIAMTQSHIAAYNILFDLRVALAKKLSQLPLGYYSNTSSGAIKKIMMGNIEAIEEFVAHNLVDLISVIFLPIIIFLWLATFNVPLALLSILPVLVGVGLQRFRMRLEATNIHKFFKIKSEMNTTIIDFIRGMPVIKAFNLSVFSFKKYKEEADRYSQYWIDMNKNAAAFFALYALMMDCGVLVLLPVGGYMLAVGQISLSTFLMFMFIGIGLSRFMKQLIAFGSNMTQIFKGVDELRTVMDAKEIEDKGTVKQLNDYDVEFKDVSFSYGDNQVLDGVNFKLRQGTITALVGPSGAGKTTVARLIPRFWDVTKGAITIGGVQLQAIQGDALMKHISFVFQDIFMFNDTVYENIRMGDPSLSEEKVIEIAKQAQAHTFIEKLDHGYQTIIGPTGTHLSGGEQQRIAIARALAKDAPIVVLDEATSYADTENEDKIQKALNALLKNKTVIVIAHRLSTIQNANQILYIEKGKIMEKGTHQQLVELRGRYKQMWDMHMDAAQWGIKQTTNQKNKQEELSC